MLTRRMPSPGMLCHVALLRTDSSKEYRFLQEPRGIKLHKSAFFIVTAVKTSDLT
jgi:hypothetical protein